MSTVTRPEGRSPRRSSWFSRALVVSVVLVTLLGAVVVPAGPAAAAPANTTTGLNLRAGPGTSYAVILVMPAGAYVEIVENLRNGYYRVRYNGTSGWAAAAYLDRSGSGGRSGTNGGGDGGSPAATGSATVTSALNLRAGPSTGDAVLAVMPRGAAVSLTGRSANGFLSVSYGGTNGWAYADFLSTSGGAAPAPDPEPDAGTTADCSGGGGAASVGSALNLRAGPGTGYAILTTMPAGAGVTLGGDSANGFVTVSYSGQCGWASETYLNRGGGNDGGSDPAPPSGAAIGAATVTSALNLRTGPALNTRILTTMPAGATVDIIGDPRDGFHPVAYAGQTGWAYSTYLNLGGGNPGGSPGNDGGYTQAELIQIIYDAAATYGQNGDDMLRVARCESGLNPYVVAPPYSASGLFQFLPGTWATTPFANQDIFDPWANANAAAWMWSVGRRGEWVCQ